MTKSLSKIIANANDFDGVFYDPARIPGYYNHFVTTYALTLCDILPTEIDYTEASKLSSESYDRYGDSITGLMEWADKRGLKGDTFRDDFFRLYHQNLRHHFIKVAPHVFAQSSEVTHALARLEGIVRNGIATHGCANEFTRPLLPSMGVAPYIQEDAIFGLADSGYLKKSTHPDLVQKCMDALGVSAEETAYPEDSDPNLKANKEMMPSLTTVFINNGRPLASKPTYIDYEFSSFEEYLRALHSAHTQNPKLIMI